MTWVVVASPVEQDVREEDEVTRCALDVHALPVDLFFLKHFLVNLRGVATVTVLFFFYTKFAWTKMYPIRRTQRDISLRVYSVSTRQTRFQFWREGTSWTRTQVLQWELLIAEVKYYGTLIQGSISFLGEKPGFQQEILPQVQCSIENPPWLWNPE